MSAPFWDVDAAAGYVELSDPADNPWDAPVVGGVVLPGISEVDCTPEMELDVKKSKGKDGGTITFHGRKPAQVTIRTYLWTPEQWSDWQSRVLPTLWPVLSKKDPQALDFRYPATEALGVRSIAVVSVSPPRPGRAFGERVVETRAIEFSGPQTATKTKTITGSKVGVRDEYNPGVATASDGTVIPATPANGAVKPSTVVITPTT